MTDTTGLRICWVRMSEGGASHVERVTVIRDPSAASTVLFSLEPAGAMQVSERPAGAVSRQFHCAPRRQLVVILSSEMRVFASDGSSEVLVAGDVLFVEDVAGD